MKRKQLFQLNFVEISGTLTREAAPNRLLPAKNLKESLHSFVRTNDACLKLDILCEFVKRDPVEWAKTEPLSAWRLMIGTNLVMCWKWNPKKGQSDHDIRITFDLRKGVLYT